MCVCCALVVVWKFSSQVGGDKRCVCVCQCVFLSLKALSAIGTLISSFAQCVCVCCALVVWFSSQGGRGGDKRCVCQCVRVVL